MNKTMVAVNRILYMWRSPTWSNPTDCYWPFWYCSRKKKQVPLGAEENGAAEDVPAPVTTEADVDLSMFDLSKKKKKKKPKKAKPDGEDDEAAGDEREEGEGNYHYETLLERIQVCLE